MNPRQVIAWLAVFFALTVGCASRRFDFVSEPSGARVLVTGKNGVVVAVGSTPLKITDDELTQKIPQHSEGGALMFRFEHEASQTAYVAIPDGGTGELSVKLRLNPLATLVLPALKEAIKQGFEAERLLIEKRYADAIVVAKKLQEKHPDLSLGWIVEATALDLQDKNTESVALWRRAAQADPEDASIARRLGSSATGEPPGAAP